MASVPRRSVPPPMSTTASGSNNAVMPATSPAFSLATNNRSKSWGSLAGSLVVKSFIVTLRQLLWLARPSLKYSVVTRRAKVMVNMSGRIRPGVKWFSLAVVAWGFYLLRSPEALGITVHDPVPFLLLIGVYVALVVACLSLVISIIEQVRRSSSAKQQGEKHGAAA